MADNAEQDHPKVEPPQEVATTPAEGKTTEMIAVDPADHAHQQWKLQVVKVSDAYGSPIIFACALVYILMRLFVADLVRNHLAKRGMPDQERKAWITRSTYIPALFAACIVDFTPIAAMVGVPLHWILAIPVGAVFYAMGGVGIHEFLRKYDPIGFIAGRFGLKKEEASKDEAEEHFREHTDMINLKKLHEDIAEREKRD